MSKIIFFLVFLLSISVPAQTNYLMQLTNPNQIDSHSFEFDIKIRSLDTNFTLSSYQCSFSFDVEISENDSISMEYIDNSSDLANSPINVIGHLSNDGINELIFTSGIGNDQITPDSVIVGKFLVSGTMDLSVNSMNMSWNFGGSINTILTGENFEDITEPSNHTNFDNSITEIETTDIIPQKFELGQNYPNPFNPTTNIDFSIPNKGNVKVIIYNTLGEKVLEAVNKVFSSGRHSIMIDGRSLSSGAYFYSIEAGKYVETKKMILLK